MGNAAGLKCLQVLANAEAAVAIELLAGAQGVEFLAPLEPGAGIRVAHDFIRSLSPTVIEDRALSGDIEAVAAAIRSGDLGAAVEREIGALQ
jgi:histidine ammonia-lyase